jgi:hypothetical protein
MNEKLQYASMLEIPVTTCSVNFKPIKKKRTVKKDLSPEAVKKELLDKVNEKATEKPKKEESVTIKKAESKIEEKKEEKTATVSKKEKTPFKFSVIGIELAVVVLLIGVIAVTNILNPNSGINVFMKSLFAKEIEVSVDNREFNEFDPVITMGSDITISENGVLTVGGSGSVYSPCDGTVASVSKMEDGTYSMEIAHSENFSTLISGLTFAYMVEGESVYYNIPVGYIEEQGVTMCFLGADGAIITGYEVIDGAVIWAV